MGRLRGRLIGSNQHRIVRRPAAKFLRNEGLNALELLPHCLAGVRRNVAHEHERGFIAVVLHVRQRRGDLGTIRCELLVEVVDVETEGPLESLAPTWFIGQADEEVDDRLLAGAFREPTLRRGIPA